jgi:hypothetical protein
MEHTHGPASSAESRALAPGHPKASTFAGRYHPSHPQQRAGWDNMMKDFHTQKEKDKKA